ncbi:MAG: DUF1818 family protein [Dolichospermum sp.]
MERVIKGGSGWRLGWDLDAVEFKGLVGTEDWAIELTEAELNEFCRLLSQLANTMKHLATELMEEEKITCEAESDLLWMEVEGYPQSYSLRLILNTGRGAEGKWEAAAVSGLLQAIGTLKVF